MCDDNIFEKFQSGFRTLHSTETVLLKVTYDLLLTVDGGASTILIVLAFITIDHAILIDPLKTWLSIKDTALSLCYSSLLERNYSVTIGNHTSSQN